jgi:hypothetical protein
LSFPDVGPREEDNMKTESFKQPGIGRRYLLKALASLGIGAPLNLIAQSRTRVSVPILRDASEIRGEEFSEERLKVIEVALQRNLDQYQALRDFEVDDLIEPAPMFVTKRYSTSDAAVHASATR